MSDNMTHDLDTARHLLDCCRDITRYASERLAQPTPSGKHYARALSLLEDALGAASLGYVPYFTMERLCAYSAAEDAIAAERGAPTLDALRSAAEAAWATLQEAYERTSGVPFDADLPEREHEATLAQLGASMGRQGFA